MSYAHDPKPETEMRIRVGHALVVRPEMLKDIEGWAGSSFQVSDIRAICKDDAVRNFGNFEALAAYKNDPDGELCALEFSMQDSHENRISAKISNESNFFIRSESASFSIVGDNGICIQLRSSIRSGMKSYRPWYWPLAWATLETLMVAYWGMLCPYFVLRILGVIEFDAIVPASLNLNNIMLYVALLIPAIWLLVRVGNFLKRHVFPSVTFSIGHGKVRDETREWIRRLVVGGTALSILTGVGSLFFRAT